MNIFHRQRLYSINILDQFVLKQRLVPRLEVQRQGSSNTFWRRNGSYRGGLHMDASDCRLIDLQRGPGSSVPGELFQAFMALADKVL